MSKERIWTLVSRKLSGEATASELAELNDCIKTQANTALYLQAIDEFWKIPPEKDEDFLEATYHLHLNRLKEKGYDLETDREKDESQGLHFNDMEYPIKKTGNKKWWVISAVPFVFILLYFSFFYGENDGAIASAVKPAQSEVSTRSGSRTKVRLADGSTVWLNGNSKLVYDYEHFGQEKREVTLSGEGYFDIVNIPGKPFLIHANKLNIKVMGTEFNIKAYPNDKNTEASLLRGSLEISLKGLGGSVKMKPNDKFVISNEATSVGGNPIPLKAGAVFKEPAWSMGRLTPSNDESTFVETAWVENKLVFDKETFEEVALKMERWYGVTILFADDLLKAQRLTGSFEKETLAEALQALQISTPIFTFKINNQIITLYKK